MKRTLLVILLATGTAPALAVPALVDEMGPREPAGAVLSFGEADLDGDGLIAAEELSEFGIDDRRFAAVDADGDGMLDPTEFSDERWRQAAAEEEEWGIVPGVADHDADL